MTPEASEPPAIHNPSNDNVPLPEDECTGGNFLYAKGAKLI